MVVSVAACFPIAGCGAVFRTVPLPPASSEAEVVADIRGVVLREGAGGGRFQFSDVSEARWTSSELVITGVVNSPGNPGHGQTRTMSFAFADVDHVLVRDYQPARTGLLVFGAGVVLTILSVVFAAKYNEWW